VILVEDDTGLRCALERLLRASGFDAKASASAEGALLLGRRGGAVDLAAHGALVGEVEQVPIVADGHGALLRCAAGMGGRGRDARRAGGVLAVIRRTTLDA